MKNIKIIMKKIISILLSICIVVCFPYCVLAEESNDYKVSVEDKTNIRPATVDEVSFNNRYCVNDNILSVIDESRIDWVDSILSFGSIIQTKDINGVSCTDYRLTNLEVLLPFCKSTVASACKYGDHLYINYETVDGLEVYLCYNSNGRAGNIVYNASSDTAYVEEYGVPIIYDHFREGIVATIPDELVEYIFQLLQDKRTDMLDLIEGIKVETTDTYVCVSPNLSTIIRANGYTNESDLFNSLINSFPTTSWISYFSRFCSYLNTNVSVRVTRTRNQYVRNSANWRSFAIGTTITLISSYLTVGASTVVNILTYLGIGISALDTIQSAVTLCRSAEYSYQGSYIGSVYDTVTLNKYVKMTWQHSTGKFAGGYDSNGNFTWIESLPASALQVNPSSIADTAAYNYNAELVLYGIIVNYYPE